MCNKNMLLLSKAHEMQLTSNSFAEVYTQQQRLILKHTKIESSHNRVRLRADYILTMTNWVKDTQRRWILAGRDQKRILRNRARDIHLVPVMGLLEKTGHDLKN
jgi:hypothetical protein